MSEPLKVGDRIAENAAALVGSWRFSVQAAYTGPILLLASNRQAAIDRTMAQRDDDELGVIYRLQQEQMEVLSLLKDAQDKHTQMLEALRHPHGATDLRLRRAR